MIFIVKCILLGIIIISIAIIPIVCIFSNKTYNEQDRCYDELEWLGYAKGGICRCPTKGISNNSLCKTCPYQK